MKDGKVAVFLELPSGEYPIGGSTVQVEKTNMGNYYFASPATGHAMVQDYQPFDFRFWCSEKSGLISPILSYTVSGSNWSSILSSGNSNWLEDKGPVSAVAEHQYGQGAFRVCQLQLQDKLNYNPTARQFLHDLLQPKKSQ